jgi:hypothetical protein
MPKHSVRAVAGPPLDAVTNESRCTDRSMSLFLL